MTTKRIKRWGLLTGISQKRPNNAEDSTISGWNRYTPSVTGLSIFQNDSWYRREGPDLLIRGHIYFDSASATEARFGLPSGLTSISGIGNTTGLDYDIAGNFFMANTASAANPLDMAILIEPSKSYLTFSIPGPSNTATTKVNGNTLIFDPDALVTFNARIPISGWEY